MLTKTFAQPLHQKALENQDKPPKDPLLSTEDLLIEKLGRINFLDAFYLMKNYNTGIAHKNRLLVVEHPSTFTLGLRTELEHLPKACTENQIPIIQCDRGGQITYHGPGQLIIYICIQLDTYFLCAQKLVELALNALIQTLGKFGVQGHSLKDAPGVYIENQKIASIGLRVRNGRSYHGISLNINTDLRPFSWINPCGKVGQKMVNLIELAPSIQEQDVESVLLNELIRNLTAHKNANKRERSL